MIGGYGALTAELHTAAVRSTARNVPSNAGRSVGGPALVVVAPVASEHH